MPLCTLYAPASGGTRHLFPGHGRRRLIKHVPRVSASLVPAHVLGDELLQVLLCRPLGRRHAQLGELSRLRLRAVAGGCRSGGGRRRVIIVSSVSLGSSDARRRRQRRQLYMLLCMSWASFGRVASHQLAGRHVLRIQRGGS